MDTTAIIRTITYRTNPRKQYDTSGSLDREHIPKRRKELENYFKEKRHRWRQYYKM